VCFLCGLLISHDFTIAATGGDISGSKLSSLLNSTDIEIQSSGGGSEGFGDINVRDQLNWNAHHLTLTAARNVNVRAIMSVTGSGGLTINTSTSNAGEPGVIGGTVDFGLTSTGFLGRIDFDGSGALTIDGVTYTVLNTLADMEGMTLNDPSVHYALGRNIDATGVSGYVPPGSSALPFKGEFNGLGHTIGHLVINRPTLSDIGLFGYITGGVLKNIGLTHGYMAGESEVGGLAGAMIDGHLLNLFYEGEVLGLMNVGGLLGVGFSTIDRSWSMGAVSAQSLVGGISGVFYGNITDSWSSSSVSGTDECGGLVGSMFGRISRSYATGVVLATAGTAGGLAGNFNYDVNLPSQQGIFDSWSSASVDGRDYAGGITGTLQAGAEVVNSYSIGRVSGFAVTGGLIGRNSGAASGCFWDPLTTGQPSGAGTGSADGMAPLSEDAWFSMSNFSGAGWKITDTFNRSMTWRIYEGHDYPRLSWTLTPLTVRANDIWTYYDGTIHSGGAGVVFRWFEGGDGPEVLKGGLEYTGSSRGARNAGSYAITPKGLWSTGYDLDFVSGSLVIARKPLLVSGLRAESKMYDGNLAARIIGQPMINLIAGDDALLRTSPTGRFATAYPKLGKMVALDWYSFTGGDAGNYDLVFEPLTANIYPLIDGGMIWNSSTRSPWLLVSPADEPRVIYLP